MARYALTMPSLRLFHGNNGEVALVSAASARWRQPIAAPQRV
jgi:hypothetical protein